MLHPNDWVRFEICPQPRINKYGSGLSNPVWGLSQICHQHSKKSLSILEKLARGSERIFMGMALKKSTPHGAEVTSTESQMKTLFVRFVKDESGVTAIEYGLIAGLVSVLIIAALQLIGGSLQAVFNAIAAALAAV
jgi:pilus assembly protein Flp/PilA